MNVVYIELFYWKLEYGFKFMSVYLDMYCGNRIRDGFFIVNQNPGWSLSCKAESIITEITGIIGITGIGTGLNCL